MAPCENCNDMSEIQQEKLSQEECQRICYSKECVVAANFILENMDVTADPCEDFYTFSCGKWIRQFSKEDNYSVVDGMTTTLQLDLKDLLEKSKGEPGSTEEKLKMMFDSCTDERASEWNSKSEARKFLEKFGIRNWPNLPNDFQFNASLDETLSIMAAFNEFAFVTFKPTYDEPQESVADNNFRKLTISPGYPLMRDESESDVYEAVLLGILRHFGANSEDADEIWTEFKTIDFSLLSLLMETSAKVRYGEDEQELLEPLNCLASIEDSMHIWKREHYVRNIFSLVTNFTQKSVGNYLALRFILNHQRDLDGFLRALGAELPDVYPLDSNRRGSSLKLGVLHQVDVPLHVLPTGSTIRQRGTARKAHGRDSERRPHLHLRRRRLRYEAKVDEESPAKKTENLKYPGSSLLAVSNYHSVRDSSWSFQMLTDSVHDSLLTPFKCSQRVFAIVVQGFLKCFAKIVRDRSSWPFEILTKSVCDRRLFEMFRKECS
ncbi:endothelin-converting enzyme 1 [Caerostris extrusa]|uniref:Endothelin-converting enzyme 1 n=1 Tax=Caerostris extrusa TaxID=172846 RepID=A0AAV4S0S0_CAEEX|nr:endothelin-converting enzyme 1 [Caerostris extrusa]